MASPLEIVQKYQAATGKGDFATARKLVHDDLAFHGPIDKFNKPEPLFEALKTLMRIVERVEIQKVFVDGNDVCVLYDMVTKTSGTELIVEWFKVKDGKISNIRVVFDARPFANLHAGRDAARKVG